MIQLLHVSGIPEVQPGDALGELIARVLPDRLHSGDLLVVAQKVVSKSEGRLVRLDTVVPSGFAVKAAQTLGGKDARLVEIILRETKRIVRMDRGKTVSTLEVDIEVPNNFDRSKGSAERRMAG